MIVCIAPVLVRQLDFWFASHRFEAAREAFLTAFSAFLFAFGIVNKAHSRQKIYALLTKLVRSRWLDIGQVLFVEVHKNAKKERGQYPAILTEQAWSIKDLLYGFIFKLKLQQQQKTERHETVLLGKKFFIAGRYKIYLQSIFGLACNHGKQGILNYLKVLIL